MGLTECTGISRSPQFRTICTADDSAKCAFTYYGIVVTVDGMSRPSPPISPSVVCASRYISDPASLSSLFRFPLHDRPSFFPALVPGPQFGGTCTNRVIFVRLGLTSARNVKSTSTLVQIRHSLLNAGANYVGGIASIR